MKANRRLRDAEEAVSPVIAVILMVAITVVLAATVFVLVSDIGKQTGTAPISVNFNKSDTGDNLTVSGASDPANWNRIGLLSSVSGVEFKLNGNASDGGAAVATSGTPTQVSATSDSIGAADYLNFCGPSGATITIIDTEANQQLGTHEFDSLKAC